MQGRPVAREHGAEGCHKKLLQPEVRLTAVAHVEALCDNGI